MHDVARPVLDAPALDAPALDAPARTEDVPAPSEDRAASALRRLRRGCARVLAAVVLLLAVGNLSIAGAWLTAEAAAAEPVAELPGVSNFRVVDAQVVRGDAPSAAGYRALAARGVTTVVDLRAEDDLAVPRDLLDRLDVRRVHLPIRDGQTPTPADVRAFLAAVERADGLVYLHCGAGVGRTGAMAAAYLVETGQASGLEALQRNLAVGPPSLEQVVYAAGLDDGERASQPSPVIEMVSRFLDAPRRIWSRLQG